MSMTTKGAVPAAPAQPDKPKTQLQRDIETVAAHAGTIEKPKPTLPVGVSVLLTNERGQVLLAKRRNNSGAGLLSTPGGRLELTEDILQCAAREFREECLAELVGPTAVIAWREHFRYGNHYIMFYVRARHYLGTIANGIPDKSEEWEWFNVEDIQPDTCTEPQDVLDLLNIGKE